MVEADIISAAKRPNRPRKANEAGSGKVARVARHRHRRRRWIIDCALSLATQRNVSTGAHSRSRARMRNSDRNVQGMHRDVPNSRLYMELRELDLRIEQYTNRKKAEICDVSQVLDEHLTTRCLRLFLYNQHFNQGGTSESEPASWSFYIYGHFVSHGATHADALQDASDKRKEQQWTAAMKSIEIKIEHSGAHPGAPEVVRWERSTHVGAHKEAIEVHRASSAPAAVTVTMVRDSAPEYFQVGGALAEHLQMRSGTRGQVLRALWASVQRSSTPKVENPAVVTLTDESLVSLFGGKELQLNTLGQHVAKYLSSVPPVVLQYAIELDGPSPSVPHCYDVEVAWQLKPAMLRLPALLDAADIKLKVEELDKEIAENLAALKQCHWKCMFYRGFATDPVEFIQRLVAQSAKEVGADHSQITSDMYKLPWAPEAAMKYISEHIDRSHAGAIGRGVGMGA